MRLVRLLAATALASALIGAVGAASAHSNQQAEQQARQQAKPDLSRPGSAFAPQSKPGKWATTVARTARGHLIGNPDAKGQLIEFISYTCPHCADFATRGEPALDMVLLSPGTMSLEVRPRIRNGLDVSVTLLAQCGDPAGFKARHQALMLTQADWLGKARAAPASQQAIWNRADKAGRMNAASALGLAELLARRGQSRSQLDACLADDAAAKKLIAVAAADKAEFAITVTPSFALDGKLLEGVHGWETLSPVLSARFAKPAG